MRSISSAPCRRENADDTKRRTGTGAETEGTDVLVPRARMFTLQQLRLSERSATKLLLLLLLLRTRSCRSSLSEKCKIIPLTFSQRYVMWPQL